ncbi:TDT family transporter [Salinicoccus sp. ID82-1]|uniref:TDT family transporter n=1 Tax=Salinicoccus cyprini TaxID=2493691 RepID=A0A558AV07_9STAP|nr:MULTISPECIES: TDT family transporter [Salinicoccus]MCG1010529.1 TDT family transporter [Salinicoccus sp. ID82-1]TVT28102.1 TDT family transporter [Salinicoccus cyprini]
MKRFLYQVPVSICGLILGLVSLGSLFFSIEHHILGWTFIIMGVLLMLPFFMKITITGRDALKSLNDPVAAAISPTFPMSLMVLSSTLSRFTANDILVLTVWWGAILMHFTLIIFFTLYFITPNRIRSEYINPGWFVTFVGIGIIPTTSRNFGVEFGQAIIWIALLFYMILLPIIIRQMIKEKASRSAFPLTAILAAPGSLCLTGYISVVVHPSEILVYTLLILSQILYFLIVLIMPKMLEIKFHPSYAALTFPTVISATAIIHVLDFFNTMGRMNIILTYLFTFELYLAVAIVAYVLIRYAHFIAKCYFESRQTYE